ncbi:MAG: hypothetical protein ACK4SM_04195 [Aquificaceae bacterium]
MTVSKEYEMAIELIKKVMPELDHLTNTEDRAVAKKIVYTIRDPITTAAYYIRVGNGPRKDELLKVLRVLVSQMRDMSDISLLKAYSKNLLSLMEEQRDG